MTLIEVKKITFNNIDNIQTIISIYKKKNNNTSIYQHITVTNSRLKIYFSQIYSQNKIKVNLDT